MIEQLKEWLKEENKQNVLLSLYTKLDKTILQKIVDFGQAKSVLYDRCMFARQYDVNCSVMRLLLDYNRYHEALSLVEHFEGKIDFNGFKVLDYGSGAGDYGVCFAKLGGKVTFYDFPNMLVCPKKRFELFGFEGEFIVVPSNILDKEYDLIVFSEVLEHLENPLQILKDCKSKYIFTTSYPYIPEETTYFDKTGHTTEAKNQAKDCREFLASNYDYFALKGGHLLSVKPT